MGDAFWHQRWDENNTPWDQGHTNVYLRQYVGRLGIARGSRVFVPLCGKAQDMQWLCEQGLPVLGVELSPVGVRAFFDERGMAYSERRQGEFQRFDSEGITLLCGDFFALTPTDLEPVAAVYDRAAIVALPPQRRAAYARALIRLLPPGTPLLVLTLEYPEHEISGPPFSVDEAEIRRSFSAHRSVEHLETREILDEEPGLRKRGLTRLREHAFLLGDS